MNKKAYNLKWFAANEEDAIRKTNEHEHKFKSCFTRDRDRILYSTEFRRLSGKTQVFVAGFDDNFRTRLTHTLEVEQIATTITVHLGLNAELSKAIALGHDLGHTPFGHVGERYLNLLMNGCYNIKDINNNLPNNEKGFKHNLQGVRVVSSLEKYDRYFKSESGLNLTNYTRWGISNHTNRHYKSCLYLYDNDKYGQDYCGYMAKQGIVCPNKGNLILDFYNNYINELDDDISWTYESFIVARADEIAQRHHDMEDGLKAGILHKASVINQIEEIFNDFLDVEDRKMIEAIKLENEYSYYMPLIGRFIINLLSKNLINNIIELFKSKKEQLRKNNNVFKDAKTILKYNNEFNDFNYSQEFRKCEKKLSDYLYNRLINSFLAQKMDGKSDFILRQLTKAYITNPQQLPDNTILTLFKNLYNRIKDNAMYIQEVKDRINFDFSNFEGEDIGELRTVLNRLHKMNLSVYKTALLRTICDYLAGMTDQFAIIQYESLYGFKINK